MGAGKRGRAQERMGGSGGTEEGGRRGSEGAELGELAQRSSSGPPAGHFKEYRRKKKKTRKKCVGKGSCPGMEQGTLQRFLCKTQSHRSSLIFPLTSQAGQQT